MNLKTILIGCYCVLSLFAQMEAQDNAWGIQVNINDTYIGRDYSASYLHIRGNNEWHGGVNWFINRVHREFELHTYRNRFYADDFVEYLGVNAGYTRRIPFKKSHLNPGIYADVDVFGAEVLTYGQAFYGAWTDQGDPVWFIDTIRTGKPVLSFSKSVGIDISPRLYKNLRFNFSTGVGLTTILSNPKKSDIIPWEKDRPFLMRLHFTWSIGLAYVFRKKTQPLPP